MFNIVNQGSSLLIKSNDNSQFPWNNGEMSIPLNSIYYIIDESDYVAFRSVSNGDILFTALIDEIQISGSNVTKETLPSLFDIVSNAASSGSGGGGSSTAGVISIDGQQGMLTTKTINGQSILGSGEITIESGGISEETDPLFTAWKNGSSIALGNSASVTGNGAIAIGTFATSTFANGITIGKYASNSGSSIVIGLSASTDTSDTVTIGKSSKTNSTKSIAIGISANTYNPSSIAIGNQAKSRSGGGIAIGSGATDNATSNAIAIGSGAIALAEYGIAIGSGATSETYRGIAIGKGASAIGDTTDAIAIGTDVITDATYPVNINNAIKIDSNDKIYIKSSGDGSFVKIPTFWKGTQSEYDALPAKYDDIIYNIIEG